VHAIIHFHSAWTCGASHHYHYSSVKFPFFYSRRKSFFHLESGRGDKEFGNKRAADTDWQICGRRGKGKKKKRDFDIRHPEEGVSHSGKRKATMQGEEKRKKRRSSLSLL